MLRPWITNLPPPFNEDDVAFYAYGGVEAYFSKTTRDNNIIAFCPTSTIVSNRRVDYLLRVFDAKHWTGEPWDRTTVTKFLEYLWGRLLAQKVLLDGNVNNIPCARLNCERLRFFKPSQWFRCNRCGRITYLNVRGVCPAWKCVGQLEQLDIEQHFGPDHHYRNVYRQMVPRDLRVREHTAQLGLERALRYQQQFKNKELDVLSCSTTFELGVDVGDLEVVFMRDVPPSPANYAQRAGRAGRRTNSAAFILTFCNRAHHDFYYFDHPQAMIKGEIATPFFKVDNARIAIRHIYSSAWAFFWKAHREFFASVGKVDDQGGFAAFRTYLDSHPGDLRSFLQRFLPRDLQVRLGIDSFAWVKKLFQEKPDKNDPEVAVTLSQSLAEYREAVQTIQRDIDARNAKNAPTDYLKRRLQNYRNTNILTFLSREDITPRYGFPVNTVELKVEDNASYTVRRDKSSYVLSRDLSQAISEYAPGAQVVVDGHLLTSRYLRRTPLGKDYGKYFNFKICPECKSITFQVEQDEDTLRKCRACGCDYMAPGGICPPKKTMLVPEFGFIAEREQKKPGLVRPQRSSRGTPFHVRSNSPQWRQLTGGTGRVEYALLYGEEIAILGNDTILICQRCGYAISMFDGQEAGKSHKNSRGEPCQGGKMAARRTASFGKPLTLGYRYKTDVFQVHFPDIDMAHYPRALSVLYAVLKAISIVLNIDADDYYGCLDYYQDDDSARGCYLLTIYDNTPGGAGHISRIERENGLQKVLQTACDIVGHCTCGGANGDASCYACLREYRNQAHHELITRQLALEVFAQLGIFPSERG